MRSPAGRAFGRAGTASRFAIAALYGAALILVVAFARF
jgi:hypothetical protein